MHCSGSTHAQLDPSTTVAAGLNHGMDCFLVTAVRFRACTPDTLLCCCQADAASAAVAPAAGAADVRQEEARWRRWVDERFVRLITVNIYRSATESFQMFEYIADTGALLCLTCCTARAHVSCKAPHVPSIGIDSARVRATGLADFTQPPVAGGRHRQSRQAVCAGRFNLVEREATRVAGALLMWGISGRMRKKYGITGDVREELFAAADEWVAALGSRRCALWCLFRCPAADCSKYKCSAGVLCRGQTALTLHREHSRCQRRAGA
jgi:hypothetical protein